MQPCSRVGTEATSGQASSTHTSGTFQNQRDDIHNAELAEPYSDFRYCVATTMDTKDTKVFKNWAIVSFVFLCGERFWLHRNQRRSKVSADSAVSALIVVISSRSFFRFRQIRLRLLSDDIEKISNPEIDIDQMETPVGLHLGARHQIAADVVDARAGGNAVDGDLRYVAFSLVAHSAERSPGTLTYGVSIGCAGVVHGRGGALPTIRLPSSRDTSGAHRSRRRAPRDWCRQPSCLDRRLCRKAYWRVEARLI